MTPWHYKWEERANGGYSLWGRVFRSFGANTKTLSEAPTAANLRGTDIYIIVDPDTPAENPQPNYVGAADIKAITDWVKAGGVLVFMGNDAGNMEFDHFNQLAKQFGIQFNQDGQIRCREMNSKRIADRARWRSDFQDGAQTYLRRFPLRAVASSEAVFQDQGDVIMAAAKVGRGIVFAVGDPCSTTNTLMAEITADLR
jgi:unsaturated rhamnogalacturonyl hydrolase